MPSLSSTHLRREIFRLTWPVVLSLVVLNTVNLVDVVMLGALGTTTLAAVGYATQCLFVVQSCMMAVGAACVAMMARAIGAGQEARARSALAANFVVGMLGFALPMTAISLIFPDRILTLLAAPDDVMELAIPYFRWTMAGSIGLAVCQLYDHALRAILDTVMAMRIALIMAFTKVVLNYALIFGELGLPEFGLVGAGMATLTSHLLGAILFCLAIARHPNPTLRPGFHDFAQLGARLPETLRLTVPALGERLTMTLALMAYFRFLAHYSVAAIAAYNVGVRILAFSWIPGIGLSVAASTLVGRALGAQDPSTARQSGAQAVKLGLLVAVTLGTGIVVMRDPVSRLFTDDPAVVAALDPFLVILGAALPFLVTHFTLAGALRGAGDTLTPLYASVLGSWVIRVPLGYLFSSVFELSLAWVWSIMLVDHFSRAIWLSWTFLKGSWTSRVGD